MTDNVLPDEPERNRSTLSACVNHNQLYLRVMMMMMMMMMMMTTTTTATATKQDYLTSVMILAKRVDNGRNMIPLDLSDWFGQWVWDARCCTLDGSLMVAYCCAL